MVVKVVYDMPLLLQHDIHDLLLQCDIRDDPV